MIKLGIAGTGFIDGNSGKEIVSIKQWKGAISIRAAY
jgi:hypothetical protein